MYDDPGTTAPSGVGEDACLEQYRSTGAGIPSTPELPSTMALAITYLRVSTREQATRGGRAEGFSIPAQRDANHRKAASIGARIVEEFVDAGESAKSSKRPNLQRMLEYVKTHKVTYCIVHKIDRLARNRADDVAICLALMDAGVTLVSATENIDDTPQGSLLHGIMSSIAEFYSRNLATEVTKGLIEKARSGGTPGKAPIGYLNSRKLDENRREIRFVELDPDRAPLVRWAFHAYATGEWTLSQLERELSARGLTSLPTPTRPAKPLTKSGLHKMLTRPYYKGTVIYKGVAYKGTHEHLVQPEVWYQVQTVLRNHVSAMERTQKHTHYLKGSLYCGQCGSRLTVANARSKTGVIYPYFVCVGRHSGRKPCTRSAVPIPRIERMVENYYAHLQIPEDTQATIREQVSGEFDRQLANGKAEMDELLVRQHEIEEQQEKLLDAHLAGAVPLELMRKRQTAMELDLQHIRSRLESMHKDYSDAKQHLEDCLRLLGNCHDMYRNCDDQNRRLCNQAFFKRIYIDADGEMQVDLAQPFTLLTSPSIRSKRMEAVKEKTDGGLSTPIQAVKGLNIGTGVDLRGLEPLTPCMPCRCATSCATDPWKSDEYSPDNSSTLHRMTGSNANRPGLPGSRACRSSGSRSRGAPAGRSRGPPGGRRGR